MKFSALVLIGALLAGGTTLALLASGGDSPVGGPSLDRSAIKADFPPSRLRCRFLHGRDMADTDKMRRCLSRQTSSSADTLPTIQAD